MIGVADVDPDMVVLGNNVSDRVRLNADAAFSLEFVAGQRRLNLTPPAGWAVESVRLGNRDMTNAVFDFDHGDIDGIEVRLTSKVTEVSGTLADANRATVTDGTIVLFPDDASRWNPGSRFLAAVRVGRNGHFRHRGLPAGEYLAVAVDYLEEGEETNPETLERLRVPSHLLGADGGGG